MNELRTLTGLRGFAALAVVAYHLRTEIPLVNGSWPVAFQYGYLGVDFFFILSGFILAYVYQDYGFFKPKGMVRFLGLRLARVYPAHIAALLAFGIFAFGTGYAQVHAERFTFAELLTHLTLTSAWGLHQSNSWNIPAWSISAEMFAYFNLPILFFLFRRLSRSTGEVSASLIFLITGYALLFIVPYFNEGSIGSSTVLALIRVICEFTMGFAGYFLSRQLPAGRPVWRHLLVFSGLGIGVVLAAGFPDILVVPLALILITATAWGNWWVPELLSHPVANWLGRISYSLYLIHYPVLVVFHLAIYRLDPPLLAWSFLAVLACIGAADLLYRTVEEPMRRRIRARLPEISKDG